MPANAVEPNSGNDEIDLIWGAKAIGARLNLSPREAFYQLEAGRIPGARKWVNWTPNLGPRVKV